MAEDEDEDEASEHWDRLKTPVGPLSVSGLRGKPSAITDRTLGGRLAGEDAISGPSQDGRTSRATGRTALLGVRVSAEMKKALEQTARKTGRPQAAIVEYLLREGLPGLVDQFGKKN